MIDFHSHILPGVDDGARTEDESKQMILEAKQYGFDKIIATSHYAVDCYEVPEYKSKTLLEELGHTKDAPELYLGSEVFITFNMLNLLQDFNASTINGTRYVLFELPLRRHFPNYKDIISNLINNDYKLILAHPERYLEVQENFDLLYELSDMGVLLQSNFSSFVGHYGFKAKSVVKKMLSEELISFMGSDVHRPGYTYPLIPKALKKMSKIASVDYIERITKSNAEKILNGEEL